MPHNPDTPTGATQNENARIAPEVAAETAASANPTLSDSHEMFIALALMVGFVMAATIIAGMNQEAGHAMLALMFLLLVMQGISHVNPFVQWVLNHPLQPTGKA